MEAFLAKALEGVIVQGPLVAFMLYLWIDTKLELRRKDAALIASLEKQSTDGQKRVELAATAAMQTASAMDKSADAHDKLTEVLRSNTAALTQATAEMALTRQFMVSHKGGGA